MAGGEALDVGGKRFVDDAASALIFAREGNQSVEAVLSVTGEPVFEGAGVETARTTDGMVVGLSGDLTEEADFGTAGPVLEGEQRGDELVAPQGDGVGIHVGVSFRCRGFLARRGSIQYPPQWRKSATQECGGRRAAPHR